MIEIDELDLKLLTEMQRDGSLSQRDLAERVGLSQNACWRRLHRLREAKVIAGSSTRIDLVALGLDLTVLVMIRTRQHSKDWSDRFRSHVDKLPEVIDFHRVGGDWDYLIKVVVRGMAGYDHFYQRLITNFDLERVTGLFSMEAITENRPINLVRALAPASSARKRV